MKKVLSLLAVFLLLISIVTASSTTVWTNSYANETGLKNLTAKNCGSGTSSVGWTTVSWDDTSANTTNCVDQVRCKTVLGTYGNTTLWKANGTSVAIDASKIMCQLNLSRTNIDQQGCTIGNFSAVCGGYAETYTATDAPTSIIDLFVTVVVLLVGMGSLIGLVFLIRWIKKNK